MRARAQIREPHIPLYLSAGRGYVYVYSPAFRPPPPSLSIHIILGELPLRFGAGGNAEHAQDRHPGRPQPRAGATHLQVTPFRVDLFEPPCRHHLSESPCPNRHIRVAYPSHVSESRI